VLILASISGIQDFLFEVRESGGQQARALRHRSFYIQLVAECAALRLLDAANAPPQGLLLCAAGKLLIDAPEVGPAKFRQVTAEIESWLLAQTHGRLRLSLAAVGATGNFAADYSRAADELRRGKLRPFAAVGTIAGQWRNDALVVAPPWDADAEAQRDANLGRRLAGAAWVSIEDRPHVTITPGPEALNVLGFSVRLSAQPPDPSEFLVSCSNLHQPNVAPPLIAVPIFRQRRLARHVPLQTDGSPVEFVDLARHSRGASMLGVLKADADSLGQAIARRLEGTADAAPLRGLSDGLDEFFSGTIEDRLRNAADPFKNIYTVFSGGDDLLMVGPWDIMLDFAASMRQEFVRRFQADGLTISAALSIIKPKYPIRLAAAQAEDLLHDAKTLVASGAAQAKDQFAALGQIWKWTRHQPIIQTGRQLADWADAGVIKSAWLRTLLELILLRRGELVGARADRPPLGVPPGPALEDGRGVRVPSAMATSRLAYHIGRNWPGARDNNRDKVAARRWADGILEQFDNPNAPDVAYLPAAIRYAMLATRTAERNDAHE